LELTLSNKEIGMAQAINSRVNNTQKNFRRRKVLTVLDLASLMQCSLITVRRKLKQWDTYTSYNKNGRYYVLPDVPQFDSNGLWRYRNICFSQNGNLTQTVIHLVRNSSAGLATFEIGELLHIQPRSFLSSFREHHDLRREKHQGCFVYFSSDQTIYEQQKNQRLTMIRSAKLPSDIEAIAILVETIKHPMMSIEELCAELKKKRYQMLPETVRNLFAYHELSVKKTPPSLY
jgi:hypothetical protein